MNIYQRINEVMKEVSYVKKDTKINDYQAVTHDQVVSIVRASMVKNGIVCYPEQVSGEILIMRDGDKIKMHLYQGEYRVHFVGIDEGDEIVCVVQSHANDNSDKAPGKALTYAVKSAMLKVFNLETGINDESREEIRENFKGISEENLAILNQLIKDTDTDIEQFCKHLKKPNLESLFNAEFSTAKGLLDSKKAKMAQAGVK